MGTSSPSKKLYLFGPPSTSEVILRRTSANVVLLGCMSTKPIKLEVVSNLIFNISDELQRGFISNYGTGRARRGTFSSAVLATFGLVVRRVVESGGQIRWPAPKLLRTVREVDGNQSKANNVWISKRR